MIVVRMRYSLSMSPDRVNFFAHTRPNRHSNYVYLAYALVCSVLTLVSICKYAVCVCVYVCVPGTVIVIILPCAATGYTVYTRRHCLTRQTIIIIIMSIDLTKKTGRTWLTTNNAHASSSHNIHYQSTDCIAYTLNSKLLGGRIFFKKCTSILHFSTLCKSRVKTVICTRCIGHDLLNRIELDFFFSLSLRSAPLCAAPMWCNHFCHLIENATIWMRSNNDDSIMKWCSFYWIENEIKIWFSCICKLSLRSETEEKIASFVLFVTN